MQGNELLIKLTEALEAKKRDIRQFTWRMAKEGSNPQQEILLMDATPEQLQQFYDHCVSMLFSKDKENPGRCVLLDIIAQQRKKCNIELFLRKLETGSLCADYKGYPRHLYLQNIQACLNANKEQFPTEELSSIPISTITGGLPREFEQISIADVIDGCLDTLGIFNNKHITFSFILRMGLFLTADELREMKADTEDTEKKKPEIIKEKLGLKPEIKLLIIPSGLSLKEFRAMLNLKTKKYSELTTDQLTTLRNKVLFRLENDIKKHIDSWKERMHQIEMVAAHRNIELIINALV